MKNFTKTILTSVSAALISGVALADSHMSMEMTIVSWGGAYSNSQLKAYHEPYSAKTGVTILNDDSSSTAVAQLRAMNEAKNITWDVVDVEAAPAMQLCDEGLAMEIDADTMLAAAPDGTPASQDFGDMLVLTMLYSTDCLFYDIWF
jgi:putative spermidine/putrescine transport system substrate-binding protein